MAETEVNVIRASAEDIVLNPYGYSTNNANVIYKAWEEKEGLKTGDTLSVPSLGNFCVYLINVSTEAGSNHWTSILAVRDPVDAEATSCAIRGSNGFGDIDYYSDYYVSIDVTNYTDLSVRQCMRVRRSLELIAIPDPEDETKTKSLAQVPNFEAREPMMITEIRGII